MRRVFISGGHGGLARAIVECFSAAGWETDAPSHAALDVGDRSAVRRWFDCHAAYDLAVCAAGITRDRPFLYKVHAADRLIFPHDQISACFLFHLSKNIRQLRKLCKA